MLLLYLFPFFSLPLFFLSSFYVFLFFYFFGVWWGAVSTYYLYSGNVLYRSNSSFHSASERGGFMSFSSFQSTIDSPDSVNLHVTTHSTCTLQHVTPAHYNM